MSPTTTMSAEEIAAFVQGCVKHEGDCTFTTIANNCPGFSAGPDDEVAYHYSAGPDILLWTGMSKVGVDAINLLLHERRVAVDPTNILVYMYDGGRVPSDKRWRPVRFVPAEMGTLAPNGILVRGKMPEPRRTRSGR